MGYKFAGVPRRGSLLCHLWKCNFGLFSEWKYVDYSVSFHCIEYILELFESICF